MVWNCSHVLHLNHQQHRFRVRWSALCAENSFAAAVQVENLRLLRHKHIVQYYGMAMTADSCFIVTELMAGEGLVVTLDCDQAMLAAQHACTWSGVQH